MPLTSDSEKGIKEAPDGSLGNGGKINSGGPSSSRLSSSSENGLPSATVSAEGEGEFRPRTCWKQ